MKHSAKVTLILVTFFMISQVIGLFIINQYIDHNTLKESGEVEFSQLPYDIERPPIEEQSSFWYILSAILVGTILLLIIIKFKGVNVWKFWYYISALVTLAVALAAFIPQLIAFIVALIASYFKVFKPHIWIHNITELFLYGGLAAIFVPVMNVFSAVMLLILISIYDAYAVWKSKHMVKLAKFTVESKVFAGLSVPYQKTSGKIVSKPSTKLGNGKTTKVRNAILGGGDIGFPLIFAGVVMKTLMQTHSVLSGFLYALIIPVFTGVALYLLFLKGEKNKFYPAMPFLSAGCFFGYGLLFVFNIL